MRTITLVCNYCQKNFERPVKQYNQCNLKRKMLPFCNRSCKSSYFNKLREKSWYVKNGKRIKQYAANRRDEYSPFKYFLTKCKLQKKHRLIDFDVDLPYLKQLWETQNGICPYTGFKMLLPESTRNHSTIKSLKKASLDRINSSKGYVRGNVEFVCLLINFAKNMYEKNEVLEFISELKSGTPAQS